jgi:hypothetical protein
MNDTLTSLVNDVYTLTNRPDLVGETTLAVRNATLKAHSLDFFDKDLFETGIQFDYAQCQQTLEYKLLVPRWRALKYIRQFVPDSTGVGGLDGDFLTVVTPDNLLDSYSRNKENVCYLAGSNLQIKCKSAFQYFLLGCYVYPDVTVEEYDSWIADSQPMAIVYEAAATVFKTIGYDEQYATYKTMVDMEYANLRISGLQTVGY